MLRRFLSTTTPATLKDLKQILLANRNVHDAELYFSPPHPLEFDVADLGIDPEQMKKAVDRIYKAAKNKEKVLIFGDYDADGISATAILWQVLKSIDIIAVPFIPKRDVHGYGITKKAIDEIRETASPSLIITVDNGVVAHEPIRYAMESGIDIIMTDHHQPDKNKDGQEIFPEAFATVHTTKLCGSTVSWMLARELSVEEATKQLDLAGLATIADQVPLQGANRAFAVHGLAALRKTKRVGLKSLSELTNIDLAVLTATSVGFSLAPRINAMGRLAHGLDALRLLCTGSWDSARKLARTLTETNVSRQDMTQDQFDVALQQVAEQKDESVIIVASDQFHEGVIGLIAGRLSEKFYKPALVMSISETTAKGSARSVAGVNVVDLLRQAREHLLEVGGHPMAAGFGVSVENIEILKTAVFTLARKTIDKTVLVPQIDVDCRLPFNLISLDTAEMIQTFEPFGSGNVEPVFVFDAIQVQNVQTVGKEQQHLKLTVADSKNQKLQCDVMAWKKGYLSETLKQGMIISLAARIEVNEWKGKKRIQLVGRDIQESN